MNTTFLLDRTARELRDASGRCFDAMTRTWTATPSGERGDAVAAIDAVAAVAWLQRESRHPLRLPIAISGPRDATGAQLLAAMQVGELLADCGLVVICDGGHGIAQALCDGVRRVGGMSIGVLPDAEPATANAFVSVVLATGVGEACHALLARTAFCVVAIGDTPASELARQYGRMVIALAGATGEGVVPVADARAAVEMVALAVLGMSPGA